MHQIRHIQNAFCLAMLMLFCSCHSQQQNESRCADIHNRLEGLANGDLFFVQDTAGMGNAISKATGRYTHVGIIECVDSTIYLWEAIPTRGVICRPFDSLPEEYSRFTCCRLNVPFDTLRLQSCLHHFLGQPYDLYFQHDNGRMYCSELVYESFFDLQGNHLFQAQPMNFKATDGTMPSYWTNLFDSLGVPVPQGQPGTNPNDLHQSDILDVISN
ncbi:MAG: hypothetical protein MJZ99_06925 [Bacteroidales bacterium]|nr:hypothetical protein [Bacteroidales bacterium]